MERIVDYISRIVVEDEEPKSVKEDVKEFASDFQRVHYCFDSALKAYEYIDVFLPESRFFNFKFSMFQVLTSLLISKPPFPLFRLEDRKLASCYQNATNISFLSEKCVLWFISLK